MRYLSIFLKVLVVVSIAVIGFWALTPNTSPTWTGFGPYDEVINGPRSKTLWDWLELLVVPAFLAIGAYLLSSTEKQSDRINEIDRQRQNTLTTFTEQISKLLLEKKLKTAKVNSEVRVTARTYALSTFRSIDGKRKAEALQFLYESRLISKDPVISLIGANLTEAKLINATLVNLEIKGAKFTNASFYGSNLHESNLCGCDLSNTNFEKAELSHANLSYTFLNGAILNNLDLTETDLEGAILDGADLTGSKIRKQQLADIASLKNAKLPKDFLN